MSASAVGAASTYTNVDRNVPASDHATPCDRICVGNISAAYLKVRSAQRFHRFPVGPPPRGSIRGRATTEVGICTEAFCPVHRSGTTASILSYRGMTPRQRNATLTAINVAHDVDSAAVEADEAEGEKHSHGETCLVGCTSVFGNHGRLQSHGQHAAGKSGNYQRQLQLCCW